MILQLISFLYLILSKYLPIVICNKRRINWCKEWMRGTKSRSETKLWKFERHIMIIFYHVSIWIISRVCLLGCVTWYSKPVTQEMGFTDIAKPGFKTSASTDKAVKHSNSIQLRQYCEFLPKVFDTYQHNRLFPVSTHHPIFVESCSH